MFIDSWGRKSFTKKEAEQKIIQAFKEEPSDYYETIGEFLNIPSEYFEWIVNHHWEEFKKRFADDIQMAETEHLEYYFEEIEEIKD